MDDKSLEDLEDKVQAGDEFSLPTVIGGLLFASGRPIPVDRLMEITAASEEAVAVALEEVGQRFNAEQHGVTLVKVAGGYQLRTVVELGRYVKQLVKVKQRRVSRAAAETLAVIAYKQPVPRAEIEKIRGVDALPTLKSLLDAKLIRVVGRDEGIGHPPLYGTTEYFLERFGLNDLADLPTAREIEQIENEPGEEGTDVADNGTGPS